MTRILNAKSMFLALALVATAISTSSLGARAQTAPVIVQDPWAVAQNVDEVAKQAQIIQNQIQQYQALAQQIQNQIQQIQYQLQSLHQLDPANVRLVATDLTTLQTIMAREHQLILHEQNIDPEFKNIYQPYSPTMDYGALYGAWDQNTTLAAQDALHVAASIANPSESPDVTYANNVKNVMKAQGQTDAVQAVGTIAAQQVEQLQKLEQLDAYRTSAEVQYYLQAKGRINVEQQREDALRQWLCRGDAASCAASASPAPSGQ